MGRVTLTLIMLVVALAPGASTVAQEQPESAVECAVPTPIPDSTDSSQVRVGLTALVKAVAACRSEGDYETMSRLVSQKYLGQVYGGGPPMSRPTFIELAKSFPTIGVRFRDFEDFRLMDDAGAIASVKLIVGSQLTLDRMTFIESNTPGAWLIDSAETRRIDPPRDHDQVRVVIRENRYVPATLSAESANIEIVVTNEDAVDHEVVVLLFDPGVTSTVLLTSDGPGLPPGVSYLGQVTVAANDKETLVLVGMEPGSFALVDLLPNDLGVPHLAFGMEGVLTVSP